MRLKDKVAIVTGGAHGIGRAICLGLSAEGAKVAIADINEKGALSVAEEIEAGGGEALALATDVSVVEDTQVMAKKTAERLGRIDILVNNAVVFVKVHVPFYELDLDDWYQKLAVNLTGPLLCSRAVFPYMRDQSRGKIINLLSSQLFFDPQPNRAPYIASKGGLLGLTRAMAKELGQFNINVNAVAPGSTFSEDPDNLAMLEMRKRAVPERALQRVEYPEDVVGAVVFFASSDSDFITGQALLVEGGRAMY